MSDGDPMPAGILPPEALPLIKKYASGKQGEFAYEPFLDAIQDVTETEWKGKVWEEFAIDLGWTALRSLPWGLGPGILGTLIFGGARECTLFVVNASRADLKLQGEAHQVHGVQVGYPKLPTDPPQTNFVPKRTDRTLGFGVWRFEKDLSFLGIGTWGTMGVLQFAKVDKKLPDGLRIAWEVPETGCCSCGVSFSTAGKARDWYDKEVDDKDIIHTKKELSVKKDDVDIHLSCMLSHSTRRENSSFMVVLLEDLN